MPAKVPIEREGPVGLEDDDTSDLGDGIVAIRSQLIAS